MTGSDAVSEMAAEASSPLLLRYLTDLIATAETWRPRRQATASRRLRPTVGCMIVGMGTPPETRRLVTICGGREAGGESRVVRGHVTR